MSDDTPKIDTATLLADIKKKANKAAALEVAPAVEAAPVVPEPAPVIEAAKLHPAGLAGLAEAAKTPELEAEYQQYTSSRNATCLITQSGKRINFTNYQYYTKDPDIIAYMDTELKNGLRGFRKGKKLTATELDPEAAKKREIIDEFKASQEGREFGNTKPKSERTTALSSDHVAN